MEKHFYLISPRSKPFKLDGEKVYTFGRDQQSSFVLGDATVSRHHATLQWENEYFVLIDEGSRNGTLVNNERIDRCPLQNGDRLQIGSYDFILRVESVDDAKSAFREERMKLLSEETIAFERSGPKLEKVGFSGNLEDFNLIEVLDSLCNNRKSGQLTIQSDQSEGEIYFEDGEAVHAVFQSFKGREAVFAMLALQSGQFSFDTNARATTTSIEETTMNLVLEGCRLLDESRSGDATDF